MSLDFSASEKWALGICFFSNLIIDWVSIGQTQAFFRISAQLKNVRHSALLIVSDFILTINFFVLIFAMTVAGFIALADSKIASQVFTVGVSTTPIRGTALAYLAPWTGGYFQNARKIDFTLRSTSKVPNASGTISIISDTEFLTIKDVINATTQSTGVRSWGFKEKLIPPPFSLGPVSSETLKMIEKGQIKRGSTEWKKLIDDYWEEEDHITIWAGHYPSGIDKNMAYTVAYNSTESMQQQFPSNLTLIPSDVGISGLLDQYSVMRSAQIPVLYACMTSATQAGIWSVSSNSQLFGQRCLKRFSTTLSSIASLVAKMRETPGSFATISFPLNSLFMTSMIMTFIIYAFTIFLIVAKAMSNTFLTKVSVLEPLFAKSPLGSAGLIVGFVLYISTLL